MLLLHLLCLPLLVRALSIEHQRAINESTINTIYPCICTDQTSCPQVSIEIDDESSTSSEDEPVLKLRSNGVPDHPVAKCNNNNATRINHKVRLPNLVEGATIDRVNAIMRCVPSIVGYAKNGIPIFNGYRVDLSRAGPPVEEIERRNEDGSTVLDYWSFDTCNGHASTSNMYHYHGMPNCLARNTVDEFIGVALDGYPITGPRIGSLNHDARNSDLDECHGNDFNDGLGYRYVINGEYPYTVGCFRGEPVRKEARTTGCPDGQTRGTLCRCEGGENSYGGSYGDRDRGDSRRGDRRRGDSRRGNSRRGGSRRGDSRRGDRFSGGRRYRRGSNRRVTAEIVQFVSLPDPTVVACAFTDKCQWAAAPSRGDRNGYNGRRGGGGHGNRGDWSDSSDQPDEDTNNGNPGVDLIPVPDVDLIPVPDVDLNEVLRIEAVMSANIENLNQECSWLGRSGWVRWCANSCPRGTQDPNCHRGNQAMSQLNHLQDLLRNEDQEVESACNGDRSLRSRDIMQRMSYLQRIGCMERKYCISP